MIKGIILDLDGTLVEKNLNVQELVKELKMGKYEKTILEYINELNGPHKEKAKSILEEYERCAAEKSKLKEGVLELFEHLKDNGIKVALVTRNNQKAVQIISKKFGLTFDVIVTRDDAKPKPSVEPLEYALSKLSLNKDEVLFIGDHRFDLESGKKAGIRTGLIKKVYKDNILNQADFSVNRLDEVIVMTEWNMV